MGAADPPGGRHLVPGPVPRLNRVALLPRSAPRGALRSRSPGPLLLGVRRAGAHRGRDPHRGGPGRDVLDHHGVGTDLGVLAEHHRAEHPGTGTDRDPVLDRGVALDALHRPPAEGDPVVQHHVIPDLGGLPDHHAHAVVDEEAPTDPRPGMDLHPGEGAHPLGEDQGRQLRAPPPQPVGEAMGPDRVQPRRGEQHGEVIGRRGVASVRRREILPDRRDGVHHPIQRARHHRRDRDQSAYCAYSGVER